MSPRSLKTHSTALALLAALSVVAPASARIFTPTTTQNVSDGVCDIDCSLRDAITAANQSAGLDVVVLGPGTYQVGSVGPDEDLNADGDLDIRDDLAIIGASAERTLLVGSSGRILDVHAGAAVEIVGIAVRQGFQPSGNGGGIRNAGQLTLTRVQVAGNEADTGAGGGIFSGGAGSSLTVVQSAIIGNLAGTLGGGIALDGPMTLSDSTVSLNSAGTIGGGIYTFEDSDAEIVNVTLTANQAGTQGGGLYAASQPFQSTKRPVLRNTILAGNTAPADRDCAGAPASGGHNLLGVGGACLDFTAGKGDLVGTAAAPRDPKLGPLTNNGGTTLTHALLAGSPAINAGASCTAADQRGLPRSSGACDIGAFELDATVCLTGGATLCLNDGRFKVTVTFEASPTNFGDARTVQLTPDTGYFWFFDPNNVELTVKVLNGCGFNQRFWVFLSGLTNVAVTVTVTDTETGATKTYTNPQGRTFRTVLDTNAFATCS